MALLKDVNATLALDILRIWSADDRWDGVEPYVVPIFFKVDGERYGASLRIFHTQPARPGSGEVDAQIAGGLIQLTVDSFADGVLPKDATVGDMKEDNPLIWVPPGNLLGRGSFYAGAQVIMRDLAFTSTLMPIPLRIDVHGQYVTAVEAFQGLLVGLEGELLLGINLAFAKVNDLFGDLFGLEEDFESCPTTDLGSSEFLNAIDAQFNAMIPGTIGGVFVLMENDAFDEDIARDLRGSVRDEVAYVINHTVNELNLTNTIPAVDRITDNTPLAENIASDLTVPVVTDFLVSVGAVMVSAISGSVAVGLYSILTGLSWLAGGRDDNIGVITVKFDHSDIGAAGSRILRSQVREIPDSDDDNRWDLSYTLTVNSVA